MRQQSLLLGLVVLLGLMSVSMAIDATDCYNVCNANEQICTRGCGEFIGCFHQCLSVKIRCVNGCMTPAASTAHPTVKALVGRHHHHHHKKHHFWPNIPIIHHAEEEIKHAFEQYIRDFAKSYAQSEFPIAYNNFATVYDLVKTWNAGEHRFDLGFTADSDKTADELPDEGVDPTLQLFGHHHHWWPHIHVHRIVEKVKHDFEKYAKEFAKVYLEYEFPIAYEAYSEVHDIVEAWKDHRHRFDILYNIYSDLTEDQIPQ